MTPELIKYIADLAKWQADVAAYVARQTSIALGQSTADSGGNSAPPPPPPPPPNPH